MAIRRVKDKDGNYRRKVYDIDINFPDGRFRKRYHLPKREVRKIHNELQKKKYFKDIGLSFKERMLTEELFENFESIEKRKVSKSSWDTYEHRVDFWKEKHHRVFEPLSRLRIEEIIEDDLGHLANKTINSYVNLLSQIYDYAISIRACEDNPAEDIPRLPGKPRRKPRYLTIKEFRKLIKYAKPFYKDLFTVMFYTGMRRDETRFLEWNDVDFKNEVIRITNKENSSTKNREERIIPMHKTVKEILSRKEKKSHLVFPSPRDAKKPYHKNSWLKIIKRCADKAGLENVNLHCLRHSHASLLVEQGVSLMAVGELLGHKSQEVTRIYAHLSPDHIKTAIKKLPDLN